MRGKNAHTFFPKKIPHALHMYIAREMNYNILWWDVAEG
jgi:hypothetical protein